MQTSHAPSCKTSRGESDFSPGEHGFADVANPWMDPTAAAQRPQPHPKPPAAQRQNLQPTQQMTQSPQLSPTQWLSQLPTEGFHQMHHPQQFVVFGPDAVARWYRDQGISS
jgi:hypothetical protein